MNFFQRTLVKFASVFYPTKFHGIENVCDSNTLICCNHLSIIDVLYLARIFDKDTNFLAKKEVVNNKLFGRFLRNFGAIPIDRENVDIRSILTIVKILKNGKNLVIFPEGTRNKTGNTDLLPFKGGSMVFAVKTKKPILPIIIYKKARIFRKNHVIIGKAFYLDEFYGRELNDQTISQMENFVRDKMIELQFQLKEIVSSKKKKRRKDK